MKILLLKTCDKRAKNCMLEKLVWNRWILDRLRHFNLYKPLIISFIVISIFTHCNFNRKQMPSNELNHRCNKSSIHDLFSPVNPLPFLHFFQP